jgi:CIC family chloride channel protein
MEWVRGSLSGFAGAALVVGAGAGLGAVGFRWLIYSVTWLATGRVQFGQQGRVASLHLPWLGIWFVLVVPVVGGLLHGPLIHRFAREARGHGVPEVMMAVAENDGRIRPQVSVVKALASALCIGTGGSVGREGPIVQIGSALASSLGQLARMPGPKLRVLVACGAAAGISATFNAPVTGVLVWPGADPPTVRYRCDLPGDPLGGGGRRDRPGVLRSAPIFSQMPHDLVIARGVDYLLVAILGLRPRRSAWGSSGCCIRPRTSATPRGEAGRNGHGQPPGVSCWDWCCWRCRRCTGSATR